MEKKGLIHVYTGDGKGKTTAAVGLAIRARGAGLSVLVAQLFKHTSSEIKVLEGVGVKYLQYSARHPLFKKYSPSELKSEKEKCTAFLKNVFETVKKENYDVLVIDELGPALAYNLVELNIMLGLIESKPGKTELVMTGRGIPDELIELADYVTDMRMVKHPFLKGIVGRKGIEY
jgi:cob(I)alamin adenosyltransferase